MFEEYITNKQRYISLNNRQEIENKQQTGGGKYKKWNTLVHNGVIFYPEYKPHRIPIKYGVDKTPIFLNPEAEEYITYYVQTRFDKYRNDRFNKNFFNDWKKLLSPETRKIITDFGLCNLEDIRNYTLAESERKKEERKKMTKEELELEKKMREEEKEKYMYAIVDGEKQVIDNFMIEPPTIFTGRGSHPLSGKIKKRLYPEDITLNIGPDMKIPIPPYDNHNWGEIIQDNTLEWIASWQNNVTQKYNYSRFGRKSGFKMKSDEKKYDRARKLKKKINKIREKNLINLSSTNPETRQLATALYLIDSLALRVGNEKKEDEAETVGVTTLKIKNVSLLEDNTIRLDFLGKDSIRYVNKFAVPPIIYMNIKEFHDNKQTNDDLFDLITSDSLNKYLKQFMKNLTSKVFRTYNASYLMQIELRKISAKYKDYDKSDKLQKIQHEYEMANLKVAKLCNHQKLASNTSSVTLEKTGTKIKDLKKIMNRLKRLKKEKTEKGQKTTSINKKIVKLQEKIKLYRSKKMIQEGSKTLSTGTSKINYIDPRITIAFLKTNGLIDNIDKFFNKTHQRQFIWALDIDKDYRF